MAMVPDFSLQHFRFHLEPKASKRGSLTQTLAEPLGRDFLMAISVGFSFHHLRFHLEPNGTSMC